MTLVLVHTHEEPPDEWDAAVFLAGPTPRSPEVPSWRPEAVALLRAGWSGGRLVVFVPEDPEGGMRGGWDEQVAWEDRELNRADVIAFWVPRDLTTLPGFTTNVEFGRWHDSGKAVLGAPPDAPGTRYLRRYAPGPVAGTLPDTVAMALRHVAAPARRAGAERDVPLHLWHRPEFQRWYAGLRAAGDELRAARPATSAPGFVWTLPVEVWIRAEDRVKSGEIVVFRPDAVAVLLYRGTEVVLVREYRPAGGYVRELPGGSGPGDPVAQALAEVREETGLILTADRLRPHGSRQVAGTFAAHHVHLFSAELTDAELTALRAAAGVPLGVGDERTFVEATTFRELLADGTDWSTLGQVAQVLAAQPRSTA